MSKYSKEQSKEHLGIIKRLLIKKPNLTIEKTIGLVNEIIGITFDKDYVAKLLKKIRGERVNRYNNATKANAVALYEDFIEDLNADLRNLYSNEKISISEKVNIIRTLAQNYKEIVNMQMDLGILERELGTMRSEVINVAEIAKLVREAQNDERFKNPKAIDGKSD